MAYKFVDASTQYITGANPSSAMPMTLACYMKPVNTTTYHVGLIVRTANASNYWQIYCAGEIAGDPIRAELVGAIGAGAVTSIAFTANAWNHGTGVFTSSTSRTAYINGGSAGSNTTSVTPTGVTEVRIGGPSTSDVAEAAIWDVALTAAEIASLGKGFKPTRIRPRSLVFYAPLVRNIQDVRKGITLTNNNSATVTDHPRVY